MSFRTAKVRVRYNNGEIRDSVGLRIIWLAAASQILFLESDKSFAIQALRKKSALQHRGTRSVSCHVGPSDT